MKEGVVMIITADPKENDMSMQKLKVITKCKRWVSEIKFSPDGTKLLVGAHDQRIYMYETAGPKAYRNVYRPMLKHSSAITHIDWSADS